MKDDNVILSVEKYNNNIGEIGQDDIENDPTYNGVICKIFINRSI